MGRAQAGKAQIERGEVYIVDLGEPIGHEQAGRRPAVIASRDFMNDGSRGTIIILPISSTIRNLDAHQKVMPPEGGLTRPSQVQTDQIRSISIDRVGPRLGRLSHDTMAQIDYLLLVILGLD